MKNKILRLLNIEGTFALWFVLTGIATQAVVFALSDDSLLSFVSGVAGVVSVVLCSQRKLSFYFWGFLQIATFVVLCIQEQLYGKLIENAFYFVTMAAGLVMWKKNLTGEEVQTRELNGIAWDVLLCILILLTLGLIYFLMQIGGCSPMFDAATTTFAISAQILMILRYQESWILWFWVDVLCVVLWVQASNWCMVMQYIFWTANCIYGMIKWKVNKE